MNNETRYYELIKILVICFWLTVVLVIGLVVVNPEEPLPIDHQLDAGRAAQVRAWTGGKAEKPVRVCCPCPCGALAFCGGGDE